MQMLKKSGAGKIALLGSVLALGVTGCDAGRETAVSGIHSGPTPEVEAWAIKELQRIERARLDQELRLQVLKARQRERQITGKSDVPVGEAFR